MTSRVHIRVAKKEEAEIIAHLNLVAGGGFVEYLLTDVIPGLSPQQIMQIRFSDKKPPFSYRCAYCAEIENEIVGIAHAYSNEYNQLPKPSEKQVIPLDRQQYLLAPLYQHVIQNSFYLNSLTVIEKYRGQGIGKKLLNHVKIQAKQENFDSIILHAWADNIDAIRLYQREGYKIIKHIDIQRQPLLPHDGGMVLMQFMLTKGN